MSKFIFIYIILFIKVKNNSNDAEKYLIKQESKTILLDHQKETNFSISMV